MPDKVKVVVALSGGVDSSVAAVLCQERGLEVVGATLRLLPGQGGPDSPEAKAAKLAARLGIEHHVLDISAEFKDSALRHCWTEYSQGRTPNPCAFCNHHLKFARLLELADRLGAARVVTGHYAVVDADAAGKPRLRRGADPDKDQSYFLCFLDAAQLARVEFPLGAMTKPQVRAKAAALGLECATSAESQDVCVAQSGDSFPEYLRGLFAAAPRPGDIVDGNGKRLGGHEGVFKYTVGQRRGLGVAMGRPAFVAQIDAANDRIVLSDNRDDLLCGALRAEGVVWSPSFDVPAGPFECLAQIRYRGAPVAATVELTGEREVTARFAVPQFAAAPGQVLALYADDVLLGAGWIAAASKIHY